MVTFDVSGGTDFNAATGLSAGPLEVVTTPKTPTAADFVVTNISQTFGSLTDVVITPVDGTKTDGVISNIKYGGIAINAIADVSGSPFAITFDVAAGAGYDGASITATETLTIVEGDTVADDFTVTGLEVTYDGTNSHTPPAINAKSGKNAEIPTDLKYAASGTMPTNAGSYAFTYTVPAEANKFKVGTDLDGGTFIIKRVAPTVSHFDLPDVSTPQTGSVSVTDPTLKSAYTDFGAVTVFFDSAANADDEPTTTVPTTAGGAKYNVTFNVAEGTNNLAATGLVIGELTFND